MDMSRILNDLRAERDRINQAIAALEALDSTAPVTRPTQPPQAVPNGRGGKRAMSASARRRISEAAKKRWAERKESTPQPQVSAKQTSPKPKAGKRGGISAAGRKRISEMMKKRWAARKKTASKTWSSKKGL